MAQGLTLKQVNIQAFFKALEAYKEALRERNGVAAASLRVHSALGADGVPKSYKRFVRQAFKYGGWR
jgi:hypothetical protein